MVFLQYCYYFYDDTDLISAEYSTLLQVHIGEIKVVRGVILSSIRICFGPFDLFLLQMIEKM